MIDLKPYGAFIEHTIRPLFEESETFVKLVKDYGITIDDFRALMKKVAVLHTFSIVIDMIKTVTCTAIVGFVAWKISASSSL